MNYEQRATLQNAIDTYGIDDQMWMVIEEMSELAKEICKHKRGKQNLDEIAEEVADVEIMLEQVKMMFNIQEDVDWNIACKIERLKNRLEGYIY
jgi:NTP pyrophosphatase (non-canonical NTP hydrolase)